MSNGNSPIVPKCCNMILYVHIGIYQQLQSMVRFFIIIDCHA